jgi:hypothetical protein
LDSWMVYGTEGPRRIAFTPHARWWNPSYVTLCKRATWR